MKDLTKKEILETVDRHRRMLNELRYNGRKAIRQGMIEGCVASIPMFAFLVFICFFPTWFKQHFVLTMLLETLVMVVPPVVMVGTKSKVNQK